MADNPGTIIVSEPSRREPLKCKQSANSLFHFVKKIEYFLPVMDKFALIPRYCKENTEYLNIDKKSIAYPMLCFCDINLHRLEEHMRFYGYYGIAFSKEWAINKGIQPIQYINSDSSLKKDFSSAFRDAIKNSEHISLATDFLLSQMKYLKPVDGIMPRDGKDEYKVFTDECEWRFIPNVKKSNMPEVVNYENISSIDVLNDALMLDISSNCWLKFDCTDVKHIIVYRKEDFINLLSVIDKNEKITEDQKPYLISKIIIWEEMEGDV